MKIFLRWMWVILGVMTLLTSCQAALTSVPSSASGSLLEAPEQNLSQLSRLEAKRGLLNWDHKDPMLLEGGDPDWGIRFRSEHLATTNQVTVEITFLETQKQVRTVIDYSERVIRDWSVKRVNSEDKTSATLSEVLSARGILRSLSEHGSGTPFLDQELTGKALLSTLRVLSTGSFGQTCTLTPDNRPSIVDLCSRLGKPALATYTVAEEKKRLKIITVSADFTEGSGRCGIEGNGPLSSFLVETDHITRDCFNHDVCVEEVCAGTDGIDRILCNTFFSDCADEFCLAIDDFFFAPDCPALADEYK